MQIKIPIEYWNNFLNRGRLNAEIQTNLWLNEDCDILWQKRRFISTLKPNSFHGYECT